MTDKGGWICGDLLQRLDCKVQINDQYALYDVLKETVCQFTGQYDKTTKRIWENDIVIIDGEDGFFVVEWDEETSKFVMNGDGITVDFDNFYGYEIDVVGNIFDNHELLEMMECKQ
jgi:hypothetical protein